MSLFPDEPDDERKKFCDKCKIWLPISKFAPRDGYHRANCRDCDIKAVKLTTHLKVLYTKPKPNSGYRCPICNRGEHEVSHEGGLNRGSWCLDHDYGTEEFRGWICHLCNRALGCFKDNVERMKNAIRYIEEHQDRVKRNDNNPPPYQGESLDDFL